MLTAYCLDKRNKLDYLTEKVLGLVFEILVKLSLRSGIPKHTVATVLIDEFEKYKKQRGLFARPVAENKSPMER